MDFKQQFSDIVNNIPFNRTLGLQLHSLDMQTSNITLQFTMRSELIGNFLQKILHGGVISSALDMAGGVAAMAAFATKHSSLSLQELAVQLGKASTVNLHVDYLRPGKGEIFEVQASLVRAGNKISVAHMALRNEIGTLIATGTGTYLLG